MKKSRLIIFASIFAMTLGIIAPIWNAKTANAATPKSNCTPAEIAKSQRNWFFYSAGLDFGANADLATPIAIDNTANVYNGTTRIVGAEGTTVVNDINGNLLFWTDGNTVWNRNQQIMPNGRALGGNGSADQSTVAFPSITDPNKFFVVSVVVGTYTGIDSSPTDPYYNPDQKMLRWSMIDMNLDGGMGDIATDYHALPLGSGYWTNEALTAVPNATGDGFWVFTTTLNKEVYAWEFNQNGPKSETPVVSQITGGPVNDITQTAGSHPEAYAAFALSPDMTKIAYVDSGKTSTGHHGHAVLFNIDTSTGKLTQTAHWDIGDGTRSTYGVDWSPSGKYIFVSSLSAPLVATDNQSLLRYDVSSGDETTIKSTEYSVIPADQVPSAVGAGSYYVGAVRRAPNGKIYVAAGEAANNVGYVHVINNPNDENPNFVWKGLQLASGSTDYISLPQFATGCVYTPPVIKNQVTFDSQGGSDVPSQIITTGNIADKVTAPTRDGYIFDHWYVCTDPSQAKFDLATPITGDLNLCAKWNAVLGAPNTGLNVSLNSVFAIVLVGLSLIALTVSLKKFKKN